MYYSIVHSKGYLLDFLVLYSTLLHFAQVPLCSRFLLIEHAGQLRFGHGLWDAVTIRLDTIQSHSMVHFFISLSPFFFSYLRLHLSLSFSLSPSSKFHAIYIYLTPSITTNKMNSLRGSASNNSSRVSCYKKCLFGGQYWAETKIRFLLESGMLKWQRNLARESPRPVRNIGHISTPFRSHCLLHLNQTFFLFQSYF